MRISTRNLLGTEMRRRSRRHLIQTIPQQLAAKFNKDGRNQKKKQPIQKKGLNMPSDISRNMGRRPNDRIKENIHRYMNQTGHQ